MVSQGSAWIMNIPDFCMSYPFLWKITFYVIHFLPRTCFLFCCVVICAKKHPANMARCLLYAVTFRAHCWVSWCFSLLLKAVKITGLAARACMAQVRPSAHRALPTHLATAAAACPKCILCLFEFVLSLWGWEQTPALFLLQVILDPLQLFHVLWLSCSIAVCHSQRHPGSGGPAAAATKADGSKCTPSLTLHCGPSICERALLAKAAVWRAT